MRDLPVSKFGRLARIWWIPALALLLAAAPGCEDAPSGEVLTAEPSNGPGDEVESGAAGREHPRESGAGVGSGVEAAAGEQPPGELGIERPPREERAEVVAAVDEARGQVAEAESDAGAEQAAVSLAVGYGPLGPRARERFWGSVEDGPPEVLDATREDLQDRHYLYSDELNQHLFYPYLEGLGGGYVGVGSDQNYLFIGWMRPNLAWLADYDPWIKALHEIYFLFFERSEDIETFIGHWSRGTRGEIRDLIESHFADHGDLDLIVEVFRQAQWRVHRRLRYLQRKMDEEEVPSFVTDEEMYTFVRELILAGRVRPMVGNLLDEHGLSGIAEVARELGVPIRAVYLSNAEQYWSYPEQFRANMRGFPYDEASIVLRAWATNPQNDDYRYAVQPALHMVAWLERPQVRRVRHLWQMESVRGPDHFPIQFLDDQPPEDDDDAEGGR